MRKQPRARERRIFSPAAVAVLARRRGPTRADPCGTLLGLQMSEMPSGETPPDLSRRDLYVDDDEANEPGRRPGSGMGFVTPLVLFGGLVLTLHSLRKIGIHFFFLPIILPFGLGGGRLVRRLVGVLRRRFFRLEGGELLLIKSSVIGTRCLGALDTTAGVFVSLVPSRFRVNGVQDVTVRVVGTTGALAVTLPGSEAARLFRQKLGILFAEGSIRVLDDRSEEPLQGAVAVRSLRVGPRGEPGVRAQRRRGRAGRSRRPGSRRRVADRRDGMGFGRRRLLSTAPSYLASFLRRPLGASRAFRRFRRHVDGRPRTPRCAARGRARSRPFRRGFGPERARAERRGRDGRGRRRGAVEARALVHCRSRRVDDFVQRRSLVGHFFASPRRLNALRATESASGRKGIRTPRLGVLFARSGRSEAPRPSGGCIHDRIQFRFARDTRLRIRTRHGDDSRSLGSFRDATGCVRVSEAGIDSRCARGGREGCRLGGFVRRGSEAPVGGRPSRRRECRGRGSTGGRSVRRRIAIVGGSASVRAGRPRHSRGPARRRRRCARRDFRRRWRSVVVRTSLGRYGSRRRIGGFDLDHCRRPRDSSPDCAVSRRPGSNCRNPSLGTVRRSSKRKSRVKLPLDVARGGRGMHGPTCMRSRSSCGTCSRSDADRRVRNKGARHARRRR